MLTETNQSERQILHVFSSMQNIDFLRAESRKTIWEEERDQLAGEVEKR
jgi:hypothetical protein